MIGKNFVIQEFVDKATYERFGDKSEWFIDPRVFKIAQLVRDLFGPVTINNWHAGGPRQWSGLRTGNSKYYTTYSQHSFGRAIDMNFKDAEIKEVTKYILDNEFTFRKLGLGGIELDKTWLHLDVRNSDELIKFYK